MSAKLSPYASPASPVCPRSVPAKSWAVPVCVPVWRTWVELLNSIYMRVRVCEA